MNLSLTDLFTLTQARIETIGRLFLSSKGDNARELHDAMHYAVFNGGKRIRPTLIYAVGQAVGADLKQLDAAACAIEFMHCYSLVHDDLPAMDNSDLRRGKPSCHKAYNEALAILVGDALQTHAFEVIAANTENYHRADQIVGMIRVLAKAGGLEGIAAGQALDITQDNTTTTKQSLTTLYRLKTGVLLEACIELALISADRADPALKKSLLHYAQTLCLAF
jgi:geranylgeranyl pyrophosphate synthase